LWALVGRILRRVGCVRVGCVEYRSVGGVSTKVRRVVDRIAYVGPRRVANVCLKHVRVPTLVVGRKAARAENRDRREE
jgi:hypothetical protein